MVAKIIILGLLVMALGIHLGKHGEKRKKEKYNFWIASIRFGIWIYLLYKADFFASF